MYTDEELGMTGTFFNIQENKENVLLKMDSKNTKNQWLLVDFSDKLEDRYGILKHHQQKLINHLIRLKHLQMF